MSAAAYRPMIATALVTGGTRGIGRAIVERLRASGASIVVAGRSDLSRPEDVGRLAQAALDAFERLDLLVHAAGAHATGLWGDGTGELAEMFAVNVHAPADLTARLLPALRAAPGQVAFINSSQGLSPAAGVGGYAATKHALKAVADSLRQELNPQGIRVLSIYPGATATPMQERIRRERGLNWDPDALMQPGDVAEMVVSAIGLPRTAEVTDIVMRPMRKTD
jgi:NADP-dependent 3-hydroxy acid dehydrogenase YdfG